MDFSTQLDDLQQRAADAKTSAKAAVSESRDQLRQRIGQAKVEVDLAAKDARQQVDEAAASARSKWAEMKADTAAKLDDFEAKMDRRPSGWSADRRPTGHRDGPVGVPGGVWLACS